MILYRKHIINSLMMLTQIMTSMHKVKIRGFKKAVVSENGKKVLSKDIK